MTTRVGLAIAAITLFTSTSSAAEPRKLEGVYWLGSKTILDAPPGERKDRLYLSLSGKAAQEMYDAMPGRARENYCEEPGLRAKEAGGLVWVKDRKGVNWSVAMTLDKGRTAPGSVC